MFSAIFTRIVTFGRTRPYLTLSILISIIHFLFFAAAVWVVESHGGTIRHILDTQDEGEYIEIAEMLLATGEFRINSQLETETFRTPLYPALVAGIFALTNGSLWVLWALHALIIGVTGSLIAILAGLIGLSRRWGLAAGALWGVSSGSLSLMISTMGSDKILPLLLALSALLLVFELPPYRRAVLIGVASGVATLTRPIGILAMLPLVLALLYFTRAPLTTRVWATGVALLVFGLVLTPWCIRNYVVAGHFSVSSLPAYNFVYYNMPIFLSHWNDSVEEDERNKLLERLGRPNLMTLRGFAYHDELKILQKEFLTEHAIPYAFFHAYKMIPFFLGSGFNIAHVIIATEAPSLRSSLFPTEQENLTSAILRGDTQTVWRNLTHYPIVTLERILWLLIFALACMAPLLASHDARPLLLLAVGMIFWIAFLSSPVVQPRYRVPAEPFIWLACVYSLAALSRKIMSPKQDPPSDQPTADTARLSSR